MATAQLNPASLTIGTIKKRDNAIAAMFCGLLPAVVLGLHFYPGWTRWAVGFAVGLVWANAFEYAYHRWLLHLPRSSFGQGHLLHHSTIGSPNEPEHVTLGSHPLAVVAMFLINGVPLVAIDLLLRTGLSAGIFLGWMVYFIVLEEVHWRIHLSDSVPRILRAAHDYHIAHHDRPNSRYNVFLPLCDYLMGSAAERKILRGTRG